MMLSKRLMVQCRLLEASDNSRASEGITRRVNFRFNVQVTVQAFQEGM